MPEGAMKTKAVDFVCYNVADMQKAVEFYRDTLGLSLSSTYEQLWAEFEIGGVTLALCGPPWGTPPQPGCQGGAAVALAVDDVPASVAELRAKGVAILQDTMDSPVCLMATIADPDGNRLWLHQRKDGTCG
jgi:predicted enzyme related to lactoylglutathione lyase